MKKRFFSFILALVLAVSTLACGTGMTAQAATNTKSGTASDIVAVALAQKQGSSGSTYIKWFWGDNKSHAWCAAFVSWCANQAGASSAIKKNGGCAQMYKDVVKAGGTVVSESNVKPGDLLFFKNSSGTLCHVAIVTAGSGSSATATHGNFSWNGSGYVVNQGIKVTSNFYDVRGNKCTRVYLRPAYNTTDTTTSTTTPPASSSGSAATTANLNGTYSLVNKASGKLLDVAGDESVSSKNKANVQVYAETGGASNMTQQFKVTQTASGWYSISPLSNSGLAVNPFSNTPTSGTNVNVYTLDTADKTQGWYLEKSGDDYIIRCAYNQTQVLTAEGTADASNVKLSAYSAGNSYQLWSLATPGQTGTGTTDPGQMAPQPSSNRVDMIDGGYIFSTYCVDVVKTEKGEKIRLGDDAVDHWVRTNGMNPYGLWGSGSFVVNPDGEYQTLTFTAYSNYDKEITVYNNKTKDSVLGSLTLKAGEPATITIDLNKTFWFVFEMPGTGGNDSFTYIYNAYME